MQVYEFQGKNTEEAIDNACRTLNMEKDMMEIEILEPGSAGIFGLVGGKKARIKVSIPEKEFEPEEESDEAVSFETNSDFEQEVAEPLDPAVLEQGTVVAREALENILSLIPLEETTVQAQKENGSIVLNIEGDKTGILIGRKGRTLDALQYIINKIVNKKLETKAQVVIDSESYRQRRQEFLTQMALEMGAKAKKIKKPVATNLLVPQDRRIVHLALKDDENLTTKSRGEGRFKKVVIIPKG